MRPRRGWLIALIGPACAHHATPVREVFTPDLVNPSPALIVEPQAATFSDQGLQQTAVRVLRAMIGAQAQQIDVTVNDAVVTLSGSVDDLAYRTLVRDAAGAVEGVRRVVDQLGIQPQAGSALELAQRVIDLLRSSPATGAESILVKSQGHVISLDGPVANEAISRRATELALTVRGVTSVVNHLSPGFIDRERTPEAIARDLRARLPHQAEAHVETHVTSSHVVVLRGRVASGEDRRQLIAAAWAAGAGHVDAQALTVVWWRPAPPWRPPAPAPDADLQRELATTLAGDERFASMPVRVDVEAGVAHLHGRVATPALSRVAEAHCWNTEGVRQVRSNVRVDASLISSDQILATLVTAQLRRDPFVDARRLSVRARAGEIALGGTVDAAPDARRAQFVAGGVPGVRQVVSDIRVERAPPPGHVSRPPDRPVATFGPALAFSRWSPR
jgi:osmotically-inducible protein OsmY